MTKHAPSQPLRSAGQAALFALALPLVSPAQTPQSPRPLTVADAIQTTRLMSPPPIWVSSSEGKLTPISRGDVAVSSDGKRWAAILVRGDLARNENRLEVIGGRLDSLESASRVEHVAQFRTSSLGNRDDTGSSYLTFSHFNPVVWLPDNERVAFYFSDGKEANHLVTVDMKTRRVERLPTGPNNVVAFAVSSKGAVLYSSRRPRDLAKGAERLRRGFVFSDANAISLLRGDVDGFTGLDTETFVIPGVGKPSRRIRSNAEGFDREPPHFDTQFSSDGRFALIDATPDTIPADWDRYTDDLFRLSVAEGRKDRTGFYARFLKGLYVVDLARATSRPLWAVPVSTRLKGSWSPDGRSILLASTYLPANQADAAGLAGRAVAEVEVATGRVRVLPVPSEVAARGIARASFLGDDTAVIDDNVAKLTFRKREGRWSLDGSVSSEASRPPEAAARIRVELRQDMNTPPRLFAIETATERERMILDLNPSLRENFALGRVEDYLWKDREGRTWTGLLYHPVHESPGRRFPLVIQTHGHAPSTVFSLYGPGPGSLALGLGPSYSVFAAQPLANRDIAVLQIEDKDDVAGAFVTPREPELHMEAYETAIEVLAASGLVDRDKVGIVGYSRTGWHVEYALTHSSFRFAAAITTDNMDGSYLQGLLNWTAETEKDLGAKPFGEGLKTWIDHAPGFNADKVRTPLRLQIESGPLTAALFKWEMFSRLSLLNRPVEFAVIPDIEHGSHGLQNPRQCLAAQEGAVDWFDFWLNGHEGPGAGKAEQYARWRKLRELAEKELPK